MMAACPDENILGLLAEGGIERGERAELEHHLDGCASCSRLVAELAQLAAPARAAPERYKIIRQLGAGAMGVVWEAEDTALARRVALKFVRPEGARDRERRARLLREARALARLRHPNVLAVHDVGTAGVDELFLALELVVGTNAREWRKASPRTPDELLATWRKVAAGLAAVHQAGIIHRDVKPDNVLVAEDGRVLISDFGLATGELAETTTTLTQTGAVLGTPLYMAPEQLRGSPVTAKSDQFALCVCIWEALSGERPFQGATVGALAIAMLQPPKLPPRVDRRIFEVLARGLAFDPATRWPTIDALDAALTAATTRRSPRRWFAYAAAAVLPAAAVLGIAAFATAEGANNPARVDHAATPSITSGPPPLDDVARPTPDNRTTTPPDTTSPPHNRTTTSPPNKRTTTSPPNNRATTAPDNRATPPPASPLHGASATSPTGLRGAQAPIPVRPAAPAPPPVQRASWFETLERATNRLALDDGRGCLTELASISPVPAERVDEAEQLKAACLMAAGDCAGGHASYEAFGRAHGKPGDAIAREIDTLDTAHCPIDAPPQAKWPARARVRLGTLLAGQGSCKPVLDIIAKRNIQMENPQELEIIRVSCLARDHDCTGARAAWRAINVPANTSAGEVTRLEQQADQTLVKVAPSCVGR